MPVLKKALISYSLTPARRSKLPPELCSRNIDLSSLQVTPVDLSATDPRKLAEHTFNNAEADHTIGRKYANQGLTLLATAVTEAQYPDKDNQAFARQLYIHALAYLLRGLPPNLSQAETATLQASIPSHLLVEHSTGFGDRPDDLTYDSTSPSLLHRLLACGIIQLFVVLSFVLPYAKTAIATAYEYERTNKISEKVFSTSLDLLDRLGKRSFGIAGLLLQIGNGKLGAMLLDTVAWWVDGISGGIHDGMEEGMALIGVPVMKSANGRR